VEKAIEGAVFALDSKKKGWLLLPRKGKSPIGMEGTSWGEPPLTDIGTVTFLSARGLAPVTGAQKRSDKGFLFKKETLEKLPETHS
jgi:hypothetical protein